jgi:DNA (cytosine-5)-methyltransferase 1
VQPWRTAAECIDFSLPCPSIFARKKPLADNTLRRIGAGLRRFVFESDRPFIVGVGGRMSQTAPRSLGQPLQTITSKADSAVVVPVLVPRYGEREGQAPRAQSVEKPLSTIVPTQNGASLVAGFLAKHYTERRPGEVQGASLFGPAPSVTTIDHSALVTSSLVSLRGTEPSHLHGDSLEEPLRTVSAGGLHAAEVRAFLVSYYTTQQRPDLFAPMPTVTTKDRLGLVIVEGLPYQLVDIGMRMLAPRELYRAQGFPDSYRIDIAFRGKPLSKTAQVRMCGNSVCPDVAAAIISANVRGASTEERAA